MARPRSFDINDALAAAAQVFLVRGFDGATLEDLTGAMGVNKPSLYAAFGDKSALYAKVLEGYGTMALSAMETALNAGDTLEDAGRTLLRGAIDMYAPSRGDHLGCLIATTATTVAGSTPAVRAVVAGFLMEVDRVIGATIARRFGDHFTEEGVASVGDILSATMYSLAIRARAGSSRKQLSAIADRAMATVAAVSQAQSRPTGAIRTAG
jgi:AcrR family transcriptional regulator